MVRIFSYDICFCKTKYSFSRHIQKVTKLHELTSLFPNIILPLELSIVSQFNCDVDCFFSLYIVVIVLAKVLVMDSLQLRVLILNLLALNSLDFLPLWIIMSHGG